MGLNNMEEFQAAETSTTIRRYSTNLNFLSGMITGFNGNSEKVFLEIGNKLRRFLTVSDQSTKLATRASEAISDEILQNGINELNSFLNDFSTYLNLSINEIQNDKKELQKILPSIESISFQLSGFDKIVKQLRMLGISTKIESARMGSEDHGFYALSETVDKLSGQINEKAVTILKKSNELVAELNKTILNLTKLEFDKKVQSESIFLNTQKSLQVFNSKHTERIEKTEIVFENSKKVYEKINEVVISIQFHDITRQRLEHINQAFSELTDKINSFLTSDDTEPTQLYSTIHNICGLQAVQLANTMEDFKNAVSSIKENLVAVGASANQILVNTSLLLDEEDLSKKSSLRKVQEELGSILVGLNKNIDIGNELSKSISAVVRVVDDLSKYVMEIEEIGSEIEIIALNARVKAARTGSNGSALGVLSETIQKLSVDAKSQTNATAEILNFISQESKNLRISVESGSYRDDNEKMMKDTEGISDLTNKLINLEKGASIYLDELRSNINALHNEIYEATEQIQVGEEAQTLMEDSTSGLNEIITDINKKGITSSGHEEFTQNLMKKYTMNTERKIHQNFTGISRNNGFTEINKNANTGNSLGDNIELF